MSTTATSLMSARKRRIVSSKPTTSRYLGVSTSPRSNTSSLLAATPSTVTNLGGGGDLVSNYSEHNEPTMATDGVGSSEGIAPQPTMENPTEKAIPASPVTAPAPQTQDSAVVAPGSSPNPQSAAPTRKKKEWRIDDPTQPLTQVSTATTNQKTRGNIARYLKRSQPNDKSADGAEGRKPVKHYTVSAPTGHPAMPFTNPPESSTPDPVTEEWKTMVKVLEMYKNLSIDEKTLKNGSAATNTESADQTILSDVQKYVEQHFPSSSEPQHDLRPKGLFSNSISVDTSALPPSESAVYAHENPTNLCARKFFIYRNALTMLGEARPAFRSFFEKFLAVITEYIDRLQLENQQSRRPHSTQAVWQTKVQKLTEQNHALEDQVEQSKTTIQTLLSEQSQSSYIVTQLQADINQMRTIKQQLHIAEQRYRGALLALAEEQRHVGMLSRVVLGMNDFEPGSSFHFESSVGALEPTTNNPKFVAKLTCMAAANGDLPVLEVLSCTA